MRILHIVPMLFDRQGRVRGGAERYAFELARHAAREADVRLLSFGQRDEHHRIESLQIRVVGGGWEEQGRAHDPSSPAILNEILWADVVHCHQREVRVSKAAAAIARVLRKVAVVTDHGGGAWSWAARIPVGRLFHRHLHVSEFSRELSGQTGWSRAVVIGAGVDTQRFTSRGNRPLNGQRAVLFVGRLLPHKAVDVLIEALPQGMTLQVVGPAPNARYLADLHQLADGKNVSFHHAWDDDRLAEAYRSCLCVVLPSVYKDRYGSETPPASELLGQALLEGMASGRPAVCTAIGGMPEVVVDGETGVVVAPSDVPGLRNVIEQLASNPAAADSMGARGRARVEEQFTWPAVVRRCFGNYRR